MSNLKKNISYNVIYQIVVVLLPLITSPIISRRLGPEMTGVYSYTYSIAYYFILFGRLGIGIYGNRTIAQHRDNVEDLNRTFWSLFIFQMISSAFMALLYGLYCTLMVSENELVAWIQILAVLSSLFDVTWFLFGIEDFKWALLRNLIVKIVGFVLIVLLIKTTSDVWIYTLIMAGTTLVGQIIMWPYVLSKVKFVKPALAEIAVHIKPNLILFLPSVAISIYQVMDKIMLGAMRPKEEVGQYEYAEKIISVLNSLISAIEAAFVPRMANLYAKDNKDKAGEYIRLTTYYISLLAPPLVLGFAAIARIFAPVYWGNQYELAGILIMILAPGVLVSVIGSVFRAEYIIPNSMDKMYTLTLFLGAFTNLVGNYILIGICGAVGASVSTTIAELVICVAQVLLVRKHLPLKQYFKDGVAFYLIGLLMFAIVYTVGSNFPVSITTLLLMILLGGVIYCILALSIITRIHNEMNEDVIIQLKRFAIKVRRKICH